MFIDFVEWGYMSWVISHDENPRGKLDKVVRVSQTRKFPFAIRPANLNRYPHRNRYFQAGVFFALDVTRGVEA